MHLYFFMLHKKAGAFYCHTYAIRPRPIAVRPRSILKRIIDFSVAMKAFYSLFSVISFTGAKYVLMMSGRPLLISASYR